MVSTLDTDARGWISFDPEGELSFGMVSPAAGEVSQRVTVLANGDAGVEVVDAWVESDSPRVYRLADGSPFPARLDPGDGMPIEVVFDPKERASYHGSFVVELGDGNTKTLNITGSGCADGDSDGDCSP